MSVRVEVVTDAGAVLAGTLTAASVERLREALGIKTPPTGRRGLVTLGRYAEQVGLSYDAARKAARRGTLPTVRVGRRVLVDLDRLDR